MHILNELTLKNLKCNKKRTCVTIFGILLSVALVTAITTFISSMQQSLLDQAKKNEGSYHILVSEVPKEQQKYFENNAKVKKRIIGQTLGEVDSSFLSEEIWTDGKPPLKVRAFEKTAWKELGINLTKGDYPTSEEEILFPANLNFGEYKVGDTISLKVNGTEKNYRISGFLFVPSFEMVSEDGGYGYTFVTVLDHDTEGEALDYALQLKHPSETYRFYEELTGEQGYEHVMTNDTLLRYEGVAKSERTMQVLYSLAAIVILIIILTSVFVIKNSFDISIMERIRQYGMLASVGATSKQLRKNVLFEGFILGIIGIPLGILSGITAIWITLKIVMNILEGSRIAGDFTLRLHISWQAVFLALLVAIVTIYFSAVIPAGKAAKISPIDAIRDRDSFEIKSKKLRSPVWLQKLLGIEGELADKNLKRSRKKYRTTVFSIFLSVVMFISISSVIKYGFVLQGYEYEEMEYNLYAYASFENEKEEKNWYEKAANLNGVEEYSIINRAIYNVKDAEYTKEMKQMLEAVGEEREDYILFVSVQEEQYLTYLKEIGLTYEEVKDKAIISDTMRQIYQNSDGETKRAQFQILKNKEGDVLSYKSIDADEADAGVQEGKIEIAKRTDKLPFGVRQDYVGDIVAVVSEEMIQQLGGHIDGIYINAEDTKATVQKMKELAPDAEVYFNDYEEQAKENNAMILIISIFLYGFIAVISVIGITNIFNTITTNMLLRSREFAILKSVGMTEKEFHRMIRYESILYAVKALVFGIPVGTGISYLMYKRFTGLIEVAYEIPWKQILIAVVAVFLLIFLTMEHAVRRANKKNIIETIRSENI